MSTQRTLFGAQPVAVGDPDGLRFYQRDAVEANFELWRNGHRSVLDRLFTAAGKTQIAGAVARTWPRKLETCSERVLFLAHTTELLSNAKRRIERMTGCIVEVEQAQMRVSTLTPTKVVVGSVQTVCKEDRLKKFGPDYFGLIIVDECHRVVSKTYREILSYFASARVLCLTATPNRADGVALRTTVDAVAINLPIMWGMNEGYFTPFKTVPVMVDAIDLDTVGTRAGEYKKEDLQALLETDGALDGIVVPTLALIGDGRTLVFSGPEVSTAKRLTERFNVHRPGCAKVVHGKTEQERKGQRKEIFDGHRRGDFQILVNVDVATEGYDDPEIVNLVLARPTKSPTKFEQMLGRGGRTVIPELDNRTNRIAAIAASRKPHFLAIDCCANFKKNAPADAVDILGGDAPPEVKARARKLAKERVMRTDEALVEAAKQVAHEKALAEQEAARRADAVRYKVKWRHEVHDSYAKLGGEYPEVPKGARLASPAQESKLRKNGLVPPVQGWSYEWAHRVCGRIDARKAEGKSSPKQIAVLKKRLEKYGVDAKELSIGQAGALMSALKANLATGYGYRFLPGQVELLTGKST